MTGTSDEALSRGPTLRQLELTVTRKLDGLLHGEIRSAGIGPGSERGESRPYQPGDDARRIDWSVTARMNELYVRDTIADRELETWLVVDGSASLDFGTARYEKRDLALTAAVAFGLLGGRGGNRIGGVLFDSTGARVMPPRSGSRAVMQLLRRIETRPREPQAGSSLTEALRRTRRTAKRRGRVVIISDLLDDGPWVPELRVLAARHDTVVAQIADPREQELPSVGLVTFVDPETGELLEVQTSDRHLRQRFTAAAADQNERIDRAVRSSGARHLSLSTDRDWLLDLTHFVARSRRAGVR